MQELFLWNTEVQKVYLKDFKKDYAVLLFFPFAYTSNCIKEVCYFNPQDYPKVDFYGISVDSPFCLKNFKEHSEVKIHLYSDFNRNVSHYFSCLEENFLGFKNVCKRAAVCIDKNFDIVYSEILENGQKQLNFTSLESFLNELL